MIYGALFFRFIGTCVRWFFELFKSIFLKKKIKSFKAVWSGPPDSDPASSAGYEMTSNIIGFVIIVIIGYALLKVT